MRVLLARHLGGRAGSYAWVVLAVTVIAHTTESVVRQGLPTLAPFFQAELDLSRAQVGLFMSALFGGTVLTAIPAGRLIDQWGIRFGLSFGLALVGLSVILAGTMRSFAEGLVLLLLTGVGHGAMNPATTRAVMVWFEARRRATAMGIKQTGIPLGGVVGAATLPLIAVAANWRLALVAGGVAILFSAALAFLLCREAPGSTATARTAGKPLLFRNRELWVVNGTSLAMSGLHLCIVTYLALYLYETRSLSAVSAAGFLILTNVGGVIGRVVWGLVSDRLFAGRRKPVALIIAVSTAATLAAVALAAPALPLPGVAVLSFLLGFTALGWTTVAITLVGEIAGREAVGAAVGLASFMNNLGIIVGPPAFGALVDVTGSYQLAWFVLSPVALLVAAALTFWLPSR